jgi:hypothetical protein
MAKLAANASRAENTSGMGTRQSIPFSGTGHRGKVARGLLGFWRRE